MSEQESQEADTPDDDADEQIEQSSEPFHLIATVSDLNDFFEAPGTVVDELKLTAAEDSLETRVVDPANVAMVDQELKTDVFESYQGNGEVLGLNLNRVQDILSMSDSDAMIELELDPETRKLHISVNGLEYTLALIDPDSIREEPDLPDLDLPATAVMEGRDLSRGLTAADMVSDHIALQVTESPNQFKIAAEGDTDDVELEKDEDDIIDLNAASVESLFSLDYLNDMETAISKDSELTLHLGDEMPVFINHKFAEGLGSTRYMLAPRIQN